MSCSSNNKIETMVIGDRVIVFSAGSTSTANVIPLSPDSLEGISAKLESARISVVVESGTPNVQVRGVFRTSEDGAVWSAVTALTSYTSNGVPRITGSWTGTPDSFKRLVQFGVDVVNGTGTAYEMAQVTVILDLRMQS